MVVNSAVSSCSLKEAPEALPARGDRRRVVVAMSGGVDSSVAAAKVIASGAEVIGVTMKLLPKLDSSFGCCGSPEEIRDAKRVCEALGIPHYTLDLADSFGRDVVGRFIDDYLAAKTPNPCVECNRSVKFDSLLRLVEAYDADALATGHYARVLETRGSEGRKVLRLGRARDRAKDQSYFLYSLTQKELRKVEFPLGEMSKDQVREEARRLGLGTADKPESQEICFVPTGDYRAFLEESASGTPAFRRANEPGDIVDGSGELLGRHRGLLHYTVGQRKGLGLYAAKPYYVTALDRENNRLVVGHDEETLEGEAQVENLVWSDLGIPDGTRIRVRIRHRHRAAKAVFRAGDTGKARVFFDEPQRAVAPGQSAVFYDPSGEAVLGGGVIA